MENFIMLKRSFLKSFLLLHLVGLVFPAAVFASEDNLKIRKSREARGKQIVEYSERVDSVKKFLEVDESNAVQTVLLQFRDYVDAASFVQIAKSNGLLIGKFHLSIGDSVSMVTVPNRVYDRDDTFINDTRIIFERNSKDRIRSMQEQLSRETSAGGKALVRYDLDEFEIGLAYLAKTPATLPLCGVEVRGSNASLRKTVSHFRRQVLSIEAAGDRRSRFAHPIAVINPKFAN
jgi:hypothetical protein